MMVEWTGFPIVMWIWFDLVWFDIRFGSTFTFILPSWELLDHQEFDVSHDSSNIISIIVSDQIVADYLSMFLLINSWWIMWDNSRLKNVTKYKTSKTMITFFGLVWFVVYNFILQFISSQDYITKVRQPRWYW